jgi:EAL domain-containing protein (putative c-di-GMP-specific phosphodiesterase class I)
MSGEDRSFQVTDGAKSGAGRPTPQITLRQLRSYVQEDRFRVLYQPVVRLPDKTITGVEALVRCPGPSGSLRGATPFVELARTSDMVLPVGRKLLARACREASRWWSPGGICGQLTLSVNMCRRQLEDDELPGTVQEILSETGLPPSSLLLEVTDLDAWDVPEARAHIEELREMGVGVAMDDFGAGDGNLAQLIDLEVDVVKIAPAFLEGLEGSPGDPAWELLRSIISLAGSLRLGVIAKGVETEAQARRLHRMGCWRAQGFHFYEPMEREEFEQLVGSSTRAS